MTRQDTIRLIEKVCRLYITQAKKMTNAEKTAMVDTWQETFSSDSYDQVERAFNSYVRHGNAFMPLPGDIIKEMSALDKAQGSRTPTGSDALFRQLVNIADTLANNKERISIVDPGGYRWSDEHQRRVYYHAESVVSTRSYTQYDFKQLPDEIQEYVEDIEGLRRIWPEIESSREMARRRFEKALPGIKAELKKREARLIKENMERKKAMM